MKSMEVARDVFEALDEDLILQEFLPGKEYGAFYYRILGEKKVTCTP